MGCQTREETRSEKRGEAKGEEKARQKMSNDTQQHRGMGSKKEKKNPLVHM